MKRSTWIRSRRSLFPKSRDLDDFHNKAERIEGEFGFVANRDKVRELPLKAKDIQEGSTFLSSDGTKLWSLRNFDSQRRLADLYLLTVKEEGISEPKLIASKGPVRQSDGSGQFPILTLS